MSRNRNNVLAGLLVLATLVLATGAVVMLAGLGEVLGTRSYVVRFDIRESIAGLTEGASVRAGGFPIGVVSDTSAWEESGVFRGTEVTISIDRRVELRRGAVPLLELPLLGSQGVINFADLGSGDALDPGTALDGVIAPPGFLAQAGYGEAERENLQSTLANARDLSERLKATVERLEGGIVGDVEFVASDVRAKWPGWSARADSIMQSVDETAARGPEIAASLEARLAQIEELASTGQAYLDENRGDVRAAVERFRAVGEKTDAFMDRLNGELTELAKGLLEEGRGALERAGAAVDDVQTLLDEQTPNIRRAMANTRLASDQLRDTLIEVRRSPWRLLYRPDTRELNYELLYDAARSYAVAVSDLRSASETLERMMVSGGDAQALDGASLAAYAEQMARAFEAYERAEREFLDRLINESDPSSSP